MKNILFAVTFSLFVYATHASCFEGPTRVQVIKKIITLEITACECRTVRFLSATPIADIIKDLYSGNNAVLTKPASQPGEKTIRLESDKTCGYYGLKDGDILYLTIKTQTQIDAELRARTAAIRETLQDKPLPTVLVGIITGYDTHNDD